MQTILKGTAAALLLAGCAETAGHNASFGMEAGAQIESPTFGNATMNNMLVQTGARDYTVALGQRFAAEVNTVVNFPFDSAALTPEAQAILRQQATWIRQFPEIRFKVFGHTDLVGSDAYNRALGLRRANAVVNYLVGLGVSRQRLEAVVSYGETRPVIPTPQREVQNRRTVTEVTGFVGNHPMVLNGKYAEVIFREYVASAVPTTEVSESSVDAGGGGGGGGE